MPDTDRRSAYPPLLGDAAGAGSTETRGGAVSSVSVTSSWRPKESPLSSLYEIFHDAFLSACAKRYTLIKGRRTRYAGVTLAMLMMYVVRMPCSKSVLRDALGTYFSDHAYGVLTLRDVKNCLFFILDQIHQRNFIEENFPHKGMQ